jgi:hypothetical protein
VSPGWDLQGPSGRAELSPSPRLSQTYSKGASLTVFFRSQRLEINRSNASHRAGLGKKPATKNLDRGDQLLGYGQEMNEKAQRVAGLFIAPLIMLIGLWLCLEGLEHGKLSGIFSIGPFVAVAGALWFVSKWFE